jgi:hypothetical protein
MPLGYPASAQANDGNGNSTSCGNRGRTSHLAEQAALRKSLLSWLRTADEAGLDDEGIMALVTSALRDFRDRRGGQCLAAGRRHRPNRVVA